MGQHKQHLRMQQLVMGGGQHIQFKKLCIWGLSLVLPFLVLFCIFPSGSSVHRPPNGRFVISQVQVPPVNAARSDHNIDTLSADEASRGETEEQPSTNGEVEEELRVSILDEPEIAEPIIKKAKRRKGGKRSRRHKNAVITKEMMGMDSNSLSPKEKAKKERKKEFDDPMIPALIDKKLDEQTSAESSQPEESSRSGKITDDEHKLTDTVNEEISLLGKEVVNQDDEASVAAVNPRIGRKPEEEKKEEGVSPLEKEIEANEEDATGRPKSSSSKKKGFIESEEEILSSGKEVGAIEEDTASSNVSSLKKRFIKPQKPNVAEAELDVVNIFLETGKIEDSIADTKAPREKKTSKAKENSTQLGKRSYVDGTAFATEERAGEEDVAAEEDRVGGEEKASQAKALAFFTKQSEKCRYDEGRWIIDSTKPYKELNQCSLLSIDDQKICALESNTSKPLGWRWQPSHCKLKGFQAKTFLNIMQRRSLAYVGDNLAKAQMQSLLCALAQVEKPTLIYEDKTNKSAAWYFTSSNFTLSMIWSPHLVQEVYENGYKKLHLDRLDTTWAVTVPTVDVLVLGVGSRFIEPTIYLVHNNVVGCSSCKDLIGQNGFGNNKERSLYSGFRATMRSALMGVGALPGFEGITLFLQPYGFEGNGSYHQVSTKMKGIQEEELYQAYERGAICNYSKMQVLPTNFMSTSSKDDIQMPTTSTCFAPSPLTNTWNDLLQQTLTRLIDYRS